MSLLFKSRDKPRAAFREWIQRILANVILYLNAVQPKFFDDANASGANQEIDMNIGYEFIFERENSSQVDKLTIKDVSTSEQLGSSIIKLEALFRLLNYTLQG